ncbi:MAG: tetratricopeptide repeat-containing protein kinase family protein [Gemmataceae bacterium]
MVLFECLAGRVPFDAPDPVGLMLKVVAEEPPPVRRFAPDTPADLELICHKCLEKDPQARYPTAVELAADLRAWRAGQPITARPVSGVMRVWKWARRNPGYAALWAGLAASLAVGTVVATGLAVWGFREADRADKEAGRLADQQRETAAALVQARTEEGRTAAALSRVEREQASTFAALNAMTDDVVGRLFARQPQLGPDEKRFLQKVIALYERATQDRADTPDGRHARAEGHFRVAKLREKLGDPAAVEADYRTAQRLWTGLAAEFPNDPLYLSRLAKTRNNLGLTLEHSGRRDQAEAEYRAAQGYGQRLTADHPTEPDYQLDLANHHLNLGVLLKDAGRPKEAEAEYTAAKRLLKPLTAAHPTEAGYRNALAATHDKLGVLFATTGRPKPAEAEWRDGVRLYEAVVAESPTDPGHRSELAHARGNLGALYADTGRPEQAVAELTAALDDQRKLAADFPAVVHYRHAVAVTLVNLASTKLNLGDVADARRLLGEGLTYSQAALRASPRHPEYRLFVRHNRLTLAETLLAAGDHSAVPPCLAEMLEYSGNPAGDRYNAALLLVQCMLAARRDAAVAGPAAAVVARRYADQATGHLRQAARLGFADAARLAADRDLAPLRDRTDFRWLVARLKAKSSKPNGRPAPASDRS